MAAATQPATAITPTIRARSKQATFWVIAGVGAVLVAIFSMLISNVAGASSISLARDNPAPGGGMALAEVLNSHGVTVVTADSLNDALDAAQSAQTGSAGATLLVYDADSILSGDQLGRISDAAAHTVVIDPDFAMLQSIAPEIGFGGSYPSENLELAGDCISTAAERAGSVSGADGGQLKTLSVPADATGYNACFSSNTAENEPTQALLVHSGTERSQLSLVADPALFANESITEAGNAALALGLLGEHPTLVWYLPTLADVADSAPPTLAELSPGWLTPVMALLVLSGIAAALAYGRRFGPLVVENLPVTVRASETMEGRARLYARNSARLRALDALRIATVSRLATRLGLARTASLAEVIATTASVTDHNPSAVQAVLVSDTPHSDAELIALSDRLLGLERAVEARTRPGGAPETTPSNPSNERMEP